VRIKEKRKMEAEPFRQPFDIALVYHVKLSITISTYPPSRNFLFDLKTIFPLSSPTDITDSVRKRKKRSKVEQSFKNNNIEKVGKGYSQNTICVCFLFNISLYIKQEYIGEFSFFSTFSRYDRKVLWFR
jgi:hypothetical protein